MLDKFEVNRYPEHLQIEESESDLENEKEKSTLKAKKTYYINNKKNSDNSSKPECTVIKNNNNTAIYQTDSKNSYRVRKSLNQKINQGGNNFTNRKKAEPLAPKNYIEEKFSYHYTNEEDNGKSIKNHKISRSNQRLYSDVGVEPHFNQTNKGSPRRSIKSIQSSQLDAEKNGNFKVLSFRPEDYELNSNMDGKSKIIQIFKKQDVGEIFFPSKRTQSPLSSAHSSDKKQKQKNLLSYQTPTLKFQSFFGSFTKSKNSKNNSQNKSKDKPKKNQLEDFNIDKLIEIGDNYSKKLIPILSFGKKVKSIKNKMKNRYNLNKNRFENTQKSCDRISNRMKDDRNEPKEMVDIAKIYEQKKENMHRYINKKNNNNNNNNNINNNLKDNDDIIINNENWKRMSISNNIIYHGQIRRKRNCHKNTKTLISNEKSKDFSNKNENNYNNEDPNINQNININIEFNNNNNKKRIIISKIKRKTVLPNHKVIEYFHSNINSPDGNQTYNRKTPTKINKYKKMDITVNNNNNKTYYSINNKNNNHHNNTLEKNNLIKNCKMMSDKNVPQRERSKKILLTEQEVIYNNNLKEKNKNIKKEGKEENYINKKYHKISSNANSQISKRRSDKIFKAKNYYGYDEANNMEGAINNHSYFESVYSRKKGLQKIISIDKINN